MPVVVTQRFGEILGIDHTDLRAAQTIGAMKLVAQKGARNKRLRTLVANLIRDCVDDPCKTDRILSYIKRHLVFRLDPMVLHQGKWIESEVIYRIDGQLDRIEKQGFTYGDCDDFATLTTAMFLAAGLRAGLQAVETGRHPGQFDHVFSVVYNRANKTWDNSDMAVSRRDWTGHRFTRTELTPMHRGFSGFPWEKFFETVPGATASTLSSIWGKQPYGPGYVGPYPTNYGQGFPPSQLSGSATISTGTILIGGAIILALVFSMRARRY